MSRAAAPRGWLVLAPLAVLLGGLTGAGRAWASPFVHDPSRIVKHRTNYYLFHTGPGCLSKWSVDLVNWQRGPRVFATPLAWWTNAVPGHRGDLWAPDLVRVSDRYLLYYSVSTWGRNRSAIGLATNPSLDPNDPDFRWTDQGIVIQSSPPDDFNAIDPAPFLDADGRLWLAFGSYWTGLKLVELDPGAGKLKSAAGPRHSLAVGSIEAPYLCRHEGWYYLFFNRGTCCVGTESTYHILVGRSKDLTGPYLDHQGRSLLDGDGTLFLETTGRQIGPGHLGLFEGEAPPRFSYHYYHADLHGAALLDVQPLHWNPEGWPAFTNRWMAHYPFSNGGHDESGGFHGTLEGAAVTTADPERGQVLDLSGGPGGLRLPRGVANARTFALWVLWQGGPRGQRLLDFGNDTNHCLSLALDGANGAPRLTITTNGPAGEQVLEAPALLRTGLWTHLAATLDGARGVLYLNGAAVSTNNGMRLSPATLRATNLWLGRGQDPTGPFFRGRLDGVRVFGPALDPASLASLPGLSDE